MAMIDCDLEEARGRWQWPSFSPAEMACKGSGRVFVHSALLDKLEQLRAAVRAVPGFEQAVLPVTSGYRSPEYNAKVSSTGADGPHTTGLAVDLQCSGQLAYLVVKCAIALKFSGIGVSQKGPHEKRFIHLDLLPHGPNSPRPWLWTY